MGTRRITALVAGTTAVAGLALGGGIALARDGNERLRADMAGTNELPATDPDGDGRARIDLDVEGGQVCWDVRFNDTGTPNRGHIHVGNANQNGGIVVPLFELVAAPTNELNDDLEEGRAHGCVDADPALLATIAANPGGYYVNLHNARFPGGTMRGQLDD